MNYSFRRRFRGLHQRQYSTNRETCFFLLYAADLSLFDCTIVELIGLELVINVGRLVLMSDYNVACRIANGLLELILKILLLI